MLGLGIRKAVKRGLKRILGMDRPTEPRPTPAETRPTPEAARPVPTGSPSAPNSPEQPVSAPTPVAAAPVEAPAPVEALATEPADDAVGQPLTPEAVQSILDELVRPALQSDGGDISLVKVDNNDVYVRLVGSCSSCPSSIMTMKMGVERLLQEEFPAMGELIQVVDAA